MTVKHGFLLGLATGALLSGCTNAPPVMVFPLPPTKYQVLGQVTGTACGVLALGGLVTNFIPLNDSTRLERAYRQAIQTLPGTTSLINVEIREDWFWWVFATTRCTLIKGDAIKWAGS